MGIISDNIANVNTIGYKANSASFSTLVTKQMSSTRYTSGGVYCRTRAGVDIQGLLSSTTYSTDMSISGSGFFVTTQTSQPDGDDLWSYTRVGNFTVDQDGYLKNDNGFYLQAWPLQSFDGYENASLVQVGENTYMKAYTDENGMTVYVNDNIIDADNLRAVNLNTIGGTAQETHKISFGANLPADDPVFNAAEPEKGGRYNSSVLVYDSLGNSHNATMTFTKTDPATWSMDIGMPSGAATLITYSSREGTNDATQDVYSARAQLEFSDIPTNHSTIAMETNGKNYVFEFTKDNTISYSAKANEIVIPVDISTGITKPADVVDKLNEIIQVTMPSAGRFSVGTNGYTLDIKQSNAGSAIKFSVRCAACVQSVANPDPVTGISTGEFELPEIDWDIKNTARIDFSSDKITDYLGKSITIGSHTYLFQDTDAETFNGMVTINVSNLLDYATGKINTVKLVSLLKQELNNNEPDFDRYVASGSTLEINPSSTGANILVSSGDSASVTFQMTNVAAYVGQTVTIGDIAGGTAKTYKFSDNAGIPSGTTLSDGSIAVNISDLTDKNGTTAAPVAVMNALYTTMQDHFKNTYGIKDLSNYIQVNGATMVSAGAYLSSSDTVVDLNKDTLSFAGLTDISDYNGKTVSINGTTYSFARGTSNSTTIDLDTLINTEELTFNAVPAAGESVVINGTTYTFVRETEKLTFTGVPAVGDTVTVNGKVYTFVDSGDDLGTGKIDVTARTAAQVMSTLQGDVGSGTLEGASLTLDKGAFTAITCANSAFETDYAGANEVSLNSLPTPSKEEAMAALGLVAGKSSSVSGATMSLSGNAFDITGCAAADPLVITMDPSVVMTALATKANVTNTGDSLSLTAFNTHAIPDGDFIPTHDVITDQPVQYFDSEAGIGNALSIAGRDNGNQFNLPNEDGLMVLTSTFSFNNVKNAQSGSLIPAASFNADGTPKQINPNSIAIEWANGAKDMTGEYYESSQISLYIGDANTANGLTQLAGKFTTNYINQDGAKFGSYSGVSISEDGVVTAIFDNGETRAIAQIPIATFVDANSLESLTGNAYIETTSSGNATLRTAGESGAGTINGNSLEESTVDIAEEFTDMITTQRAYSAASKIITTADSMLEELLTIKR